jgi:hypothetical protein
VFKKRCYQNFSSALDSHWLRFACLLKNDSLLLRIGKKGILTIPGINNLSVPLRHLLSLLTFLAKASWLQSEQVVSSYLPTTSQLSDIYDMNSSTQGKLINKGLLSLRVSQYWSKIVT